MLDSGILDSSPMKTMAWLTKPRLVIALTSVPACSISVSRTRSSEEETATPSPQSAGHQPQQTAAQQAPAPSPQPSPSVKAFYQQLADRQRAAQAEVERRNEEQKAEEEAAAQAAVEAKKKEQQEAEARQSEEQARLASRRYSTPPAAGTFEWNASHYAKGTGCEIWQSESLTVSIAEDGTATWSALSRSDGRCSEGQFVPATCGRKGEGFLEKNEKLHLATTQREKYGGGGTASVTSVWKCGSLQVHAPIDWTPSGSERCYRLGSEPDPSVERASELVCRYAEIFPELNDPGPEVSLAPTGLSFVHAGRRIKLKPAKNASP